MYDQVKVQLLDEEQLVLQDLLQSSLLSCRVFLKVAHKLRTGNIKLVHLTGQVRTRQPGGDRRQSLKILHR